MTVIEKVSFLQDKGTSVWYMKNINFIKKFFRSSRIVRILIILLHMKAGREKWNIDPRSRSGLKGLNILEMDDPLQMLSGNGEKGRITIVHVSLKIKI